MTAFLPLEPDAWVMVHHAHDGSGLYGALGPFDSEEEGRRTVTLLDELAGYNAWTPVPLRTVSVGTVMRLLTREEVGDSPPPTQPAIGCKCQPRCLDITACPTMYTAAPL